MISYRKKFALPVVALACICSAACNAPTCVTVGQLPLIITVRDSATQGVITGMPLVVVSASTFTDTVKLTYSTGTNPDTVIGVFQFRPNRDYAGLYRIQISHRAYVTWTRDGILVTRTQCYLNTVPVNVYLQKKPGG